MTTTNKATRHDATPGFAIRLEEDTDLGMTTLIVEDEAGGYQPLGPVSTIAEAREMARQDLHRRMSDLERGGEPFCPAVYKVWATGLEGRYAVAATFDSTTL